MEKIYSRFVSKQVLFLLLSFICAGQLWATNVSGDVSGTWTKANSPYVLVGGVKVTSILTIEPGVIVQMPSGTSTFDVSGTLIAKGTPTDSIKFISGSITYHSQTGPITIGVGSPSVLQYVIIDGLGYDLYNEYSVAIKIQSSTCTVSNCTIRNMKKASALKISNSDYPINEIRDNVFTGNSLRDVLIDLDYVRFLKNNNALKIGLTADYSMSKNDTLTSNNTSYRILANQTITQGKNLIINAGVYVEFPNGTSNIDVVGSIKAYGEDTNKVFFTGDDVSYHNQTGPIIFEAQSPASILNNVNISKLGYDLRSDYTAAIIVSASSCQILNCQIQNTYGTGMKITTATPKIDGNIFTGNSNLDVDLDLDKIKYLTNNNKLKVGLLRQADMGSNDTLVSNIFYRILENQIIPQNKILTINPGITIQFPNGTSQVLVSGTLKALGNTDDYINFSGYGGVSYHNQEGPITFDATSINSVLQFVTIDGLGYDLNSDNTPIVVVKSSSFTMVNSTIQNSKGVAFSIQASSPLFERSCFFYNRAAVLSSGGSASFSECNFIGNSSFGINNTSTTNVINADSCFWGDLSGPKQIKTNPGGSGDMVSDNVNYTPFSTIQYDCGDPLTILPLTLLNFQATLANNTVNCTWQTATETNTSYFIVQRSTDGIGFTNLSKVYASGNSAATRSYSFADKSPNNGINYYRLQMVDKDGRYTYSKTVPINIAIKQPFAIYPNPVKDVLYVQVQRSLAEKVSLQIVDMQGNIVLQQSHQLSAGVTSLSANTTALAKGTYFAVIKGQTTEKKIFIKE